jgi:6-phosphogluconolactonase
LAETVYTETYSASDNAIQIFQASDGSLTFTGSISASGKGTGTGLGNQGALALSEDGQWLFAVDAGSNEISTFAISGIGLALVARASSGGTRPVSVTTHGNRLYVVNAGGSGNVNGFTVQSNGHLKAIPGSTRPLSTSGSSPAQIGVDRDGDTLFVTEKATNQISTYTNRPRT